MIIFKHTETPTSHVYTVRAVYFWISLILIFGGLIVMKYIYSLEGHSYNILVPLFIIWFIIFLGMFIDVLPVLFRQSVAGLKGKKRTLSGNAFRDARYEIEK